MKHIHWWIGALSGAALLSGTAVSQPAFAAEDGGRGQESEKRHGAHFVRMFPELPAGLPATDDARNLVKRMGEKGGLVDALDILQDPKLSITDPATNSPNNPDNPNMTAGVTFVGQFLDHDLTFDPNSPLLEKTNPQNTTNFRTPRFDLDSVYGGGPDTSPNLYDLSSGLIKLRVETIPGAEQVSVGGAT